MNLLGLYPNKLDATSYYRGISPIEELINLDKSLIIKTCNKLGWSELCGIDLVFYQRPLNDNHKIVYKIVKLNNKKIVCDYDDLLSEVPKDNPFCRVHKGYDYKANYKSFLSISDAVILSTNYLKEHLIEYKYLPKNSTVKVINNGFNDYLFKPDFKFSNFNKVILWRGTETHDCDFQHYKQEILSLVKDNKDFVFIFMGYLPYQELKQCSNAVFKETTDIIDYMHTIKEYMPSIGFYPLLEIPFNKAKSNIFKIEATFAGAVTLTPKWGKEWIWSSKDDYLYENKKDFKEKFNTLIKRVRDKDESIIREYESSTKYIMNNYLLSNLNKKRLELFRELCQ
jgi:Txe/YoeB family toxin of Txe-Axe toxin-antitoxin module